MTAILVGDYTPGSNEWHAARTRGIGASEISAVVGLNPWESPYSLWLKKKGLIPASEESGAMEWGHLLEPVVATKFANAHEEYAVEIVGTHRHSEREWQMANLDRLLTKRQIVGGQLERAPLEIKTTRYPDDWGRSGTDQIPLHVRCQVMQQMDVFGAPYAWVAVLIGGSDYREYRINFDESDAASLRDAGAAFWASLQTDDTPPVDASFATYNAVRALHPEIDDEDAELDPAMWSAFAHSKREADTWAGSHRRFKSEVLSVMGRAKRGLVNGQPVVRRQPGRGGSVSLYPINQKEAS
jgi:putative phage-type endonuclease